MTYEEWLEANYYLDDACSRLLYEESFEGTQLSYENWRKRYDYADTGIARADYALHKSGPKARRGIEAIVT